ncbi:dipeptide/oligopeptide/nickel ABC transporter permease/ATP-binding protein [Actinophytocola gossypii]|uniref:Dipeptide/oligopeptide/nickel ABC transporter permease/ATP-binding protein n=1 Tax=Actinophytocola gossypii TaxID=2812003 RepID=A0ABT2J3A3_9PSEU|nr:dipeptide/oligopeptide/nickel ABC transporter permease/ATP-binding protein [Actinophytocola gossypii]MCT2582256.1 dipeptide/oligopeptide/nickel ABC transporter permease/ATP-binding protein [Actinophytocola gossypii]
MSAAAGRSRFVARALRQRGMLVWSGIVLLIALASVCAPLLTDFDPNVGVFGDSMAAPSAEHWLGADRYGRDVLTRVLYGGQVALLAAVEAVAIALALGVPLGLVAGYVSGWFDKIVMRVVDGVMSVPFLVLAIAVIAAIGPGLANAMAVVGVVYAMSVLRLVRGEVLSAKEELYVDGLKVSGVSGPKILFGHILRNIAPPVIVQATLMFATAIVAEATLSYLGLGVPQPTASWGSMLSDAQHTIRENFFFVIPPGVAIFLTVLGVNQIGEGLRDLFSREIAVGRLGLNVVHPAPRGQGEPVVEPGEPDRPVALEVEGLSVSFPHQDAGRVTVVRDVSLRLHRGEVLCLVGESGSGKSVTAMSMLGLVSHPGTVTAASIRIGDDEISGLDFAGMRSIRGNRVGVVFQDPLGSLNPTFTVGNQMREAITAHRDVSRAEADRIAVELFERVGIPRAAERLADYPFQFSGGMAQRVMIAMALSCDPDVLVADEPTTALDVTVQQQVLDLLVSLRDERGMAVLLITHDLGVVAEVADSVAVMYAGQLVETGPVSEVFTRPRHPYTQGLLDSVPRNELATGPLASIPGVVPQPADWPDGCHFADRCPFAVDACGGEPVPLVLLPDRTRGVRCVRSGELDLPGLGDHGPGTEPVREHADSHVEAGRP